MGACAAPPGLQDEAGTKSETAAVSLPCGLPILHFRRITALLVAAGEPVFRDRPHATDVRLDNYIEVMPASAVPRSWTPEQATSLAPDSASLKAAQGLASARKWTSLGHDDRFVWGLAQGSGKDPYQSQIDLDEPAFKCSCPSRKFPCKHGLGLLLLHASQPVPEAARPAWVEEWAAKRAERVAKAEAKAAQPAEAPDPAAQARRREKRQANMAAGLAFLDGWLRDLARQGFASLQGATYAFWDEAARRLVDAQAPGLARRLKLLSSLTGSAASEEQLLAGLGRLHLLVSAAQRREALTPEWQEEIDAQLGWTSDQDELRTRTGEQAVWFTAAQTSSEESGVITRTTYLFAENRPPALVLEFSHASQALASTLALGRSCSGELVRFPGVRAERALFKGPSSDAERPALRCLDSCAELLAAHAEQLAANPWRDELPTLVRLTPAFDSSGWRLQDATGALLPLARDFAARWELLACSGGHPVALCGLWNGFHFRPLSLLTAEGAASFSP